MVVLCLLAAGMLVRPPAALALPWSVEVVDRLKTLGILPLWTGTRRPVAAVELRAALREVDSSAVALLAPADRQMLDRLRWEAGPEEWPVAGVGVAGGNVARLYALQRDYFALVSTPYRATQGMVGWAVDSPTAGMWIGPESPFLLGRERMGWGPGGAGGLLFADAAPPFDRLQYSAAWPTVRYTKVVGWLDGGRSLVAGRADWMVRPHLRLGFSEAVVMDGAPYWVYVVQPVPFLINQILGHVLRAQQQGIDDNYLGTVDLEWLPHPGLRLYGEVLIDDLTLPPNPFPWRWGATVGVQTARREGGGYLIQYTVVPNWTYSASRPALHYLLRGFPLAHPLGADFDALHLRWTLSSTASPTLWATYIRKGEGEVGRFWTDLTEATTYAFLRGVVEYSLVVGVDWRVGGGPGGLVATIRPWVVRRENAGHVPGRTETDWGVEVAAQWTGD
ncbi:MAG: capsule assembly Wzi family protein [Armatimonadota bacterium]|nr:capsule assembly Wzi family protein [Armatimonadota bacterium]